jgi:hypothetical protein
MLFSFVSFPKMFWNNFNNFYYAFSTAQLHMILITFKYYFDFIQNYKLFIT